MMTIGYTTVPIMAWIGIILVELIDLVAEAFMKKSGHFTNIRATGIAYLLDIITTTVCIWCYSGVDFLTVNFVIDIVQDVGSVLISVFFFKESMTISKIIAIVLILTGTVFLLLSEEDEEDRWAPWPSSWDEPLWGTGSKASSYDGPIAIDASFTNSDSDSACSSSIDSSNSTDNGNDYTSIMDDNALLEL